MNQTQKGREHLFSLCNLRDHCKKDYTNLWAISRRQTEENKPYYGISDYWNSGRHNGKSLLWYQQSEHDKSYPIAFFFFSWIHETKKHLKLFK